MTETIPEAKRHLREARQEKAAEFWQKTIQAGQAAGHVRQVQQQPSQERTQKQQRP